MGMGTLPVTVQAEGSPFSSRFVLASLAFSLLRPSSVPKHVGTLVVQGLSLRAEEVIVGIATEIVVAAEVIHVIDQQVGLEVL